MIVLILILGILYLGYLINISIQIMDNYDYCNYSTKKELLLDLLVPFRMWIMYFVTQYNKLD